MHPLATNSWLPVYGARRERRHLARRGRREEHHLEEGRHQGGDGEGEDPAQEHQERRHEHLLCGGAAPSWTGTVCRVGKPCRSRSRPQCTPLPGHGLRPASARAGRACSRTRRAVVLVAAGAAPGSRVAQIGPGHHVQLDERRPCRPCRRPRARKMFHSLRRGQDVHLGLADHPALALDERAAGEREEEDDEPERSPASTATRPAPATSPGFCQDVGQHVVDHPHAQDGEGLRAGRDGSGR